MRALAGTIVDTQALLETVGAALLAGVGVALTFSIAILGAIRMSEAGRGQQPVQAVAFAVLSVLGLVATLAAIVFGIVVMTSK